MRGDLVAIGRELRRQVLQWTGLPTSVGFGPTKTLAKLANHVAKTADRKPGSLPGATGAGLQLRQLSAGELECGDARHRRSATVWGIGRKTSARLHEAGIRTVLDLVRRRRATLRRQFSVVLEKTVLELRGTPCLDVDDAPRANQQIMCSRSFGDPVTELAGITEVGQRVRLARGARSCASRQRRRRGAGVHQRPARTARTTGSTARARRCR